MGTQIERNSIKNEVRKSMRKKSRMPGSAWRVGRQGGRPSSRLNHLFSSRSRLVFVSSSSCYVLRSLYDYVLKSRLRPLTPFDVLLRLFCPTFVSLIVMKRLETSQKKPNARSLKRSMLHTSSIDVPSLDVNLRLPADPKLICLKNETETCPNEHAETLIVFEGFRPNGNHH